MSVPAVARHAFALLLLLAAASSPVSALAARDARTVGYVQPVPGAVVRGFEPPADPFGPGHRGADLAAPRGTVVRPAGPGVVVFAGRVAGRAWVTVAHPDGVRTSYGTLGSLAVRAGQQVTPATPLGTLDGRPHLGRVRSVLHWGARRGGVYIDPMELLAGGRERVPTLIGRGDWETDDQPNVPGYEDWEGTHRFGFVPGSPKADGAGWVFAPNLNHVVGVAGLSSSSRDVPLDLEHLGYHPRDITYLSYAGRAGGANHLDDPRRDQLPYLPDDTYRGVVEAAHRLRDQLREQWSRSPGQAVDLVGHSMGGLVIHYYLAVLHDPGDSTLPPIDHVATLASPLEGVDGAAGVVEAAGTPLGRVSLDLLSRLPFVPDLQSQALADVALNSSVVQTIQEGWQRHLADPYTSPFALGTDVFTFGGSRDVIVPEHRSDLDGAGHVVLPGLHTSMTQTEAARIALRAFLADQPVPGQSGGVGHWLSYPYGWATHAVAWSLGGTWPTSPIPPGADR